MTDELELIIQRMLDAGESEESIKLVIENYDAVAEQPDMVNEPKDPSLDLPLSNATSGTRETSWWRGEEGFIPDEFQPGVSRPDVIVDPENTLYDYSPDIQHIAVEDLQIQIGDSWRNKEGNAAELLNKHYGADGQNLDVKFIEAKAGYNQLKMVVDGVELDGEINLTKNTDWNDLQKNIQLKIDDNFGRKRVKQQREIDLLDKITSAPSLQNILDFDPNGKNFAEFAHTLDKAFNPDKEIIPQYPSLLSPELSETEKYGGRLDTENRQNILMPFKQAVGEIVTLGGYDQYVADMNGGITLDDGTYVPYTYIWDKRKDLQKIQTITDNSILTEKKIEIHGGEDEFNQYIADNAYIYLDEPEEIEIRNKHIELKGTENEDDRKIIEADINKLWKKLYPDLSDEDIEKLTLYNKDGEFIDIRRPEGEGDPSIEQDAEDLARRFGEDYLVKERQQAYINLINIQKRVYRNREKISEETKSIIKAAGGTFDWSNDALGQDISQAMYVAQNEDIFLGAPGEGLSNQPVLPTIVEGIPSENLALTDKNYVNATLSELPGTSALATEYNEALRNFKVLSRSVDLNLNINQTPEENLWKETLNNLSETFVGEKAITENDSDEARDAWVGILEHDGYEVPEHIIESTFWRNGKLGKNSTTRKVVEGGSEIVTDLAPLLLELAVFKKLGGLKKLQGLLGPKSKLVTRLTGKMTNPAGRFIVDKMIAPGVITAAEWSTAESAGELVTGGAWKAHTIDWEKGETNLTMPITMGMSGGVFGKFSQAAMKGFGNSHFGRAILPRIQNPDGWLNKTKIGAAAKTLGAIPQMAGQGATATTMLLMAETSQALIDEAVKQKDFALAERLGEITNTEHIISTWFAMTVLSGKDISPKAREAFRTTVANLKTNKEATAKAYKELNVNESSSWGEINRATREKLEEVYESDLSIKEINAKVKEIKQMSKNLKLNKLIKSSRDAAIKDGRYYEDFVLPRWEIMRNLSTKPVNEWKAADYKQIKELSHNELYQVLRRSGIEPNSKEFKQYENIHETIKQLNHVADYWGIDAGLPKFREEYIQNTLSLEINNTRINDLKQKIKDGKDISMSRIELKKLEETNKGIEERMGTLFNRAEIDFNKKLKGEVAAAKVLAESLGASIKTYGKGGDLTRKQWLEKAEKEGFDAETEGLYKEKGKEGEIHLNLDAIKETRNLGTPIHEVVHHVLRNAITKFSKEKGKKVVTENGIAIIDGLMQKFSPKEQKIIQKRIDDNYRYDVNGKERAKEDYYDEYITSIGDAIKNKQIKYDQSKFRKIGNLVYPMIGKLMPKLYKGVASGTSSAKATKDLYNMLGDIYLSSSSMRVKKGLKQLSETTGEKGKAVANTAYEAYSKSTSKFKEPINKIGEKVGKIINGKEFTVDNMIAELYGKTGEGVLPQLIRFQLKPYERNPDFSYEDMVSETIMEGMALMRSFDLTMKRPGTEFGLYGYLDRFMREKTKTALPKVSKKKFTEKLYDETGKLKDVEDVGPTAEEMFDAKVKAKAIVETAPNLRKSLVNEKGEVGIKDSDAIVETIKNAVVKTLGGKLPIVTTKKFKTDLQNSYKAFLKKPIADMMGTRSKYDNFLNNNHLVLQKFIPVSKLVQLERNVKPEDRIFTTEKKRLTTQKEVREAVDKGLIDPNISETAGNILYSKNNYTPEQWFDFFRGKKVGASTKGTRKDALAEIIGIEMAFDMTIEIAKSPEIIEKRRAIELKTSEQAQIEIAEMAKRIDRNPDMKFSKNAKISKKKLTKEEKAIIKTKKLKEAANAHDQMLWLMNEVRTRGREGVFDTDGKLLSIYKDVKISQGAVETVLNLDNKGKIYPEPHKLEIAGQEKYMQGLSKTIRSGVFETIPIQYGIQLGKGTIRMLTDKVTEGGYPDFHSIVHNAFPFNVEVKMFDSQLPRNAIGESLNFTTGKHSFKGKDSYNAQMQSMLAEGAPARKKWADYVLKEMQASGINIKEITNKTKVPEDIYLKAQELGLQAPTTIVKSFKNGLDYIRDKYLAKILKDGTEVSNHYIEIQSILGKELGLYRIHDFNPLNLNVPKLDALIDLRLRFSASATSPVKAPKGYEKFHKDGQKYYSASMTFIPVMNMHSITKSSPYSISVKSKFVKLLKSPEFAKLKELNPKEVTEKITKQIQNVLGANYKASKSSKKEIIEDMRSIDKAINLGRLANKKKRGMSTFDFDETVGVSENYVIATKGGKTKKIASDQWPVVGEKMVNEGWKMDFSDFNKVTKGKPGPLMQKMKNQIKKFGPDNVFILTARAQESAPAIHEYLKSEGINIPKKNITGLGNSTGEAKALWMLKKFSEGYNDMYFVDDALGNVKAVKDVLNQLDVKSNVQQVKFSKNKNLSKDFNKILEEVKGIEREKTFSLAKGQLVGAKKRGTFFGTPGMEDFSGLVTYAFAGKGKKGEAHKKFFNDNLQKPFNRAYNDIHSRKQNISTDYKALREAMPDVRRTLNETVDGVYTVDQAIRVHLWERAGMEIPGLSKKDIKTLTDYVRKDGRLTLFADMLSQITMLPEGYLKPANHWLGENITMDMNNVVDRVYRKEALAEFLENREAIFGKWNNGRIEGANMNKIESAYGPRHREALENMLWRMENGTNRTVGTDSNTNKWMNWVNSATGTIMFFNQKSAVLQTISSLNYVNGTFNNPLRAAQAFANQPQYWKDFARIFNSDMLVQRRAGLKINVEAAELLERVGGGEGGFARFRAYLLEKGFIPTKYADSFAIASGGATYYRNSIRKYKNQGLSVKEAETKAWEDFTLMTEATQQSSRPDLISMQQASALGRPILAFANTPMQMFRRHKRRIQDIANKRGNTVENAASALYYGFAQTMIFSFLANAMFAVDDESDDPKDIAFAEKKKSRHVNTILDSYLRGMGTGGAGVAALKNGILTFIKETKKDWNADYGNVVIDMLNVSPPIGSKARKLYSAGKTYKYNKEVIPEMGLRLDNPAVLAVANVISATTNLPTDRVVMKLQNIKDASNSDFETWQRICMLMGLNKWAIGAKDEDLEAEMKAIEERLKKGKTNNKGLSDYEKWKLKQKKKQEKILSR